MDLTVGFVGFGEAAYHIARGLRQPGIAPITAYDINTHTSGLGEKIRGRAEETGTRLEETNADLARSSTIILSTVTANQAASAAEQTAPFLKAHHIYADLNSVSPGVKQSLERTIIAPVRDLSKSPSWRLFHRMVTAYRCLQAAERRKSSQRS